MANDSQQYYITIPSANGETMIITSEILPEQLLPLVQKKQFKQEKVDISSWATAYKKIIENLTENSSPSLGSISLLDNIINVNAGNNTQIKLSPSSNEHNSDCNSAASSLISGRSSLPSILLRHSSNLQSSVSNEHSRTAGTIADNSSNYITLQISQSNSNLPTLAFTQPQTLLHYSQQDPDSPNTVLIPISLHNSNQYSQQQILVAAASGEYNQNCSDGDNNLSSSSLAKLMSGHNLNPQSINLSSIMKSSSPNSDISHDSKSSNNKRKYDFGTTDEFGRRKETRLLKNREAAKECRRKKKEYVKCLENRVSNLEQQNKILMDEINRIKELYSKKSAKKSEAENDKYYEGSNTAGHPMTLAPIASISLADSLNDLNRPQCITKELGPAMRVATHANNGGDGGFHASMMEASGSQLTVLLTNETSSKRTLNCPLYVPNSAIFPEFRQETDCKTDSSSPCDLS